MVAGISGGVTAVWSGGVTAVWSGVGGGVAAVRSGVGGGVTAVRSGGVTAVWSGVGGAADHGSSIVPMRVPVEMAGRVA